MEHNWFVDPVQLQYSLLPTSYVVQCTSTGSQILIMITTAESSHLISFQVSPFHVQIATQCCDVHARSHNRKQMQPSTGID